jgi:molybdenum cofactor biosynthesis enzyme
MTLLSHTDSDVKARMVNVSAKYVTPRSATAELIPLCHQCSLDSMEIAKVRLIKKSGGRSGNYVR